MEMNATVEIEVDRERRKRSALATWFILSAAVVLVITGAAKVWTAFAPTKVLAVADPITGVSFGHLLLAVGVVELVIASICLFAKSQTLKLGLIAWLCCLSHCPLMSTFSSQPHPRWPTTS